MFKLNRINFKFKKERRNNCVLLKDLNNIKFYNDVIYREAKKFSPNDFKLELLDKISKSKNYSKENFIIFYDVMKNTDSLLFNSSQIESNIFLIKPGFIGREYSKSPSIYLKNEFNEFNETIFQVLNGSGYFLLENENCETGIRNIKIIKISRNSIVIIPKNFSFTIINTSKENLVLLNLKRKDIDFNFNNLNKINGSSLFLTKKGFIRNRNISPIYHLEHFEGDHLEDYLFNKEKGLYLEFIEIPDKFNFLKINANSET